jgi:MoaA/NifB/PqqE/SkfB family radical SAM enzyme
VSLVTAPPSAQARVSLHRAVIFVTTHCNFRCGFCEFAADQLPREKKIHFPYEQWRGLLAELRALGCRELYLTGGEPLMHPQFWEMVEEAQAARLAVHRITTNGSMAKRLGEREFRLAREAVRAVQVSVDSPRAEQHDRLRGFEGAFERLSEFLRALRANGVRSHVSNVILRENFTAAPDLVAWAASLGVEHVNFQPCNWDTNYGDYAPVEDKSRFQVPAEEMDRLERALAEAQREAKRRGVTTNLPILRRWVRAFFECGGTEEFFFHRMFPKFRCYVPHTTIYIGSSGEVFPCTLLSRVGSLRDHGLRDLWTKAMQPVRDHLDKGQFYSACNSCYCDFPANIRKNLTRHPVRNMGLAVRTLAYYTERLRTH